MSLRSPKHTLLNIHHILHLEPLSSDTDILYETQIFCSSYLNLMFTPLTILIDHHLPTIAKKVKKGGWVNLQNTLSKKVDDIAWEDPGGPGGPDPPF